MFYHLLADLVVILHLIFIIFVIFGGLTVLLWQRIIWIHIPCVVWGILLEINSWICPLTYLENYFRKSAGKEDYSTGFIQQYLVPIVYPRGLEPDFQVILGLLLIIINIIIYLFIWYQLKMGTNRSN